MSFPLSILIIKVYPTFFFVCVLAPTESYLCWISTQKWIFCVCKARGVALVLLLWLQVVIVGDPSRHQQTLTHMLAWPRAEMGDGPSDGWEKNKKFEICGAIRRVICMNLPAKRWFKVTCRRNWVGAVLCVQTTFVDKRDKLVSCLNDGKFSRRLSSSPWRYLVAD